MSYATAYIYCDKCNYTNTANIEPIGLFYQILIFNELHFKSTDGWCNSCNKNVLIEDFNTERKFFIQDEYLKWKKSIKGKLLIFFLTNLWWKRQINKNNSPRRCLNCGSTDIEKIIIPYQEEIDKPIRLNYLHPNCGGNLFVKNIGLRFISKYHKKKYYTLNGKFIREKDERIYR